jgi:D-3-phosphoglycerate dehydrogenase
VRKAQSIEEVMKGSDFVTLHVPLNERTKHLVNAKRLGLARPFAGAPQLRARRHRGRGGARRRRCTTRRCAATSPTFPGERLKGVAGVMALPHLGASTEEAEENCAVMVADELREFLEQGTVRNAVNFPGVEMARESPHRIAIANANVPNMLGQISTTMAQAGLNIHNMVNKSRGEMAYTLVDLDSAAAPEVIARIAHIPGVLSIRAIPEAGRMNEAERGAELERLREGIDRLDERLLELLNERAKLAAPSAR